MAIGGRYDLEAVRRAAEEAKRKARIKAIVSNCTAGLVLVAIAIGAKIGWDKWQEHREAERKAAAIAAEKEEYERRLAEERREKEAAERRERQERQRLEREAEEARRRQAREDELRRQEEARAREAEEREAARRRELEEREWQAENKGFADRAVAALRFAIDDYLVVEAESEAGVFARVDGARWEDLSAKAAAKSTIEFLDTVNAEGAVTNAYSEARYPDKATLRALLNLLDAEKFVMVVRFDRERLQNQKLMLVAPDLAEGLATPAGARAMKDSSGRVDGWTAPFVYKRTWPMFVMRREAVDRFNRDWRAVRRKILKDAAKLTDAEAFVDARLKSEMEGSVDALKVDLATLRVQSAPASKDAEKRSTGLKPSVRLKGSNSNIKSFR